MESDLTKSQQNLPILNIETATTISVDQTPTPTRFIKNCEEVGLFQDLQNVNPFEEVFKKAVNSANILQINDAKLNTDDTTLHTPHIFPTDEDMPSKYSSIQTKEDDDDFTLSDTLVVDLETNNLTSTHTSSVNVVVERKNVNLSTIRSKIKTKLKENDDNVEEMGVSTKSNGKNDKKTELTEIRDRIREMNRMAQIRCRKRKQVRISNMEQENKILRDENRKLKSELALMKKQVNALQRIILKYENERNNVSPDDPLRFDPSVPIISSVTASTIKKPPVPILPKPADSPVISLTNGKYSIVLNNPSKFIKHKGKK